MVQSVKKVKMWILMRQSYPSDVTCELIRHTQLVYLLIRNIEITGGGKEFDCKNSGD